MPYLKDLTRCPQEFFDLLDLLKTRGKLEFRLTHKELCSFRGRWNSFTKVLRETHKHPDNVFSRKVYTSSRPAPSRLADVSDMYIFTIEAGKSIGSAYMPAGVLDVLRAEGASRPEALPEDPSFPGVEDPSAEALADFARSGASKDPVDYRNPPWNQEAAGPQKPVESPGPSAPSPGVAKTKEDYGLE